MNERIEDALKQVSPVLLRSFLAVAETLSFTGAAHRLALRQSTVSQHVQRLEQHTRRRLFQRDTHGVTLTADGAAMCDFAYGVLEANERMVRYFAGSAGRQKLRLGISEDFAVRQLANVLKRFRATYPEVDLELTIGLSSALYQSYDTGDLDVIFAKRRTGDARGETAWRERLAWIGPPGFEIQHDGPVPLVAYVPPSITRSRAVAALESARRPWYLACSSSSLNGIRASVEAGLGIAAHSERLVPEGLEVLPDAGLPDLGEIEFVAVGPGRHNPRASALISTLVGQT